MGYGGGPGGEAEGGQQSHGVDVDFEWSELHAGVEVEADGEAGWGVRGRGAAGGGLVSIVERFGVSGCLAYLVGMRMVGRLLFVDNAWERTGRDVAGDRVRWHRRSAMEV